MGREKNCCYRENKNATRATKNVTLEMNKFTENECLPDFDRKFKILENLTLKTTRKHIEEKSKMAEKREESQTTVLSEENQTSIAKENQTGINAEKSQASIPENQTTVAYTDDELVSFKKTLKKVQVHIRKPSAVLVQGKTPQTN